MLASDDRVQRASDEADLAECRGVSSANVALLPLLRDWRLQYMQMVCALVSKTEEVPSERKAVDVPASRRPRR